MLFGWVDEAERNDRRAPNLRAHQLAAHAGPARRRSRAWTAFPAEDRPPVQVTFQSYHLMVGIGVGLIALVGRGAAPLVAGPALERRAVLWRFVFGVIGPVVANEAGWMAAEVGRQPWIV